MYHYGQKCNKKDALKSAENEIVFFVYALKNFIEVILMMEGAASGLKELYRRFIEAPEVLMKNGQYKRLYK